VFQYIEYMCPFQTVQRVITSFEASVGEGFPLLSSHGMRDSHTSPLFTHLTVHYLTKQHSHAGRAPQTLLMH